MGEQSSPEDRVAELESALQVAEQERDFAMDESLADLYDRRTRRLMALARASLLISRAYQGEGEVFSATQGTILRAIAELADPEAQ